MGKFGRALAAGIAGASGAAGEIFDDRIKNKEFDRREALLEKRQKTLASFRHGLTMERDASRDVVATGVRDENRDYTELARPSGQRIGGVSQSKLDMSLMNDEDLKTSGAISEQTYKDAELDKKYARQDEKARQRQLDALALAEKRNERYGGKEEKYTLSQQKYDEKKAGESIIAGITKYDPIATLDERGFTIDIPENSQKVFDQIKADIQAKGFSSDTVTLKDGQVKIYLTGFNPKVYKKNLSVAAGLAAPKPVDPSQELGNAIDVFLRKQKRAIKVGPLE